jgi:hypothetical protein
MPRSSIKLLLDSRAGLDVKAVLADSLTFIVLMVALFASVMANGRGWSKGAPRGVVYQ